MHLHAVLKVNRFQWVCCFILSSDFIQFKHFRVKSIIQTSVLCMADYFIKFLSLFSWRGKKNKHWILHGRQSFRIIISRVGTWEGGILSLMAKYMLLYIIPKVTWLNSSEVFFWSFGSSCNFPDSISTVYCLLWICQNFKQAYPHMLMLKYSVAPTSPSNASKGVENCLNLPALGTEGRMM